MQGIRSLPAGASALVALAVLLAAQTGPKPDGWPDFRGPRRDGHAPSARVPLEWSEKKNVRWKTPIRGQGWSSPVVESDKIWLTSATSKGHEMFVLALDLASGEEILARTLFHNEEPEPKNALNSYASPSPVIDEGRVYVHFGTYGTACLSTASGATIWQRRDIRCDHMEGPGSSPVLVGDLLIFNVDGGDVQYVIALDKETGKTKWKTERSENLQQFVPDRRKAYSTPIVLEVDGEQRLISSGARATVAYDPVSGKELWKLRHEGFSMSSRPIAGSGLLFLNTGFMRPRLLAVRPDGEGDVTDDNVVWTCHRNVPTIPSPLHVGGRLYMVSDNGILTCLAAKTGKRLWRERLDGPHCASPVYAAGRIYFFDRDGRTVVVAPGPEYRELAVNELDDGFMASPAVVGNAFILRTRTHLYRIEED